MLTWILALLMFLIIKSMISGKSREKRIETVFAGREPLDEYRFYERHFAAQGVPFFVVAQVRRIMERCLDADFSRLEDEDDFSTDLRFFWEEDSLADVEMIQSFEDEFGIKITPDEASRMRTVKDIIHCIWGKLQQRGGMSLDRGAV